jgi:hypothetical protein
MKNTTKYRPLDDGEMANRLQQLADRLRQKLQPLSDAVKEAQDEQQRRSEEDAK